MSTRPPEIPYPFPPERPIPTPAPPVIPVVIDPGSSGPYERLLAQRRVVVRGRLDTDAATRIAAELMALDAESSREIELLVNSAGGPVADVLALLDVMALVRGKVVTTCFGQALGTAAAVVACGSGVRRATTNATLSLRCRDEEAAPGTAAEVEAQAAQARQQRAQLADLLAAATHRPPAAMAAELDSGGLLDARAAVAAGLIDEVAPPRR
jgi:ATP-dependent Clp protease protease subunit